MPDVAATAAIASVAAAAASRLPAADRYADAATTPIVVDVAPTVTCGWDSETPPHEG